MSGVSGGSDRVPVIARLELPDGRRFDIHTDVEEKYQDSQLFWWTEGNGACDCNRSLYLNREYHLNLGVDDGDDVPSMECGHTLSLLSLSVNGKEHLCLE